MAGVKPETGHVAAERDLRNRMRVIGSISACQVDAGRNLDIAPPVRCPAARNTPQDAP